MRDLTPRASTLLVFPLLLMLAACGGGGDGGTPTPMGTAEQATAGQASMTEGEQQTDAVYAQLTPKISAYETTAQVSFLASAPLDLKALRQGKVTDRTTARRLLSGALLQTKLTKAELELRYGTWDENHNPISANDPPDEIVINYRNGITARFYEFTFTPTTNYVAGFKLQVTSPDALLNTADWVAMDLTVALSDFDTSWGVANTVRYTGPVSFWYVDPKSLVGSNKSFNIDFRLTQDLNTLGAVQDLMVTDPTTNVYWHLVLGETYSQLAANVDRFTITVDYNDSNTMVYSLAFVTDFEFVNDIDSKTTMTATGGAYFQGAQIGVVSGGPMVFDATGVIGPPIMMTWTNGQVDFIW